MDNLNPAVPSSSATPTGTPPPEGWAVGAGRGAAWWGEGWRLFKASPWVWIALLIVFIVIALVLAVIPIIGQIALTLFYPVLVGGVLMGTRELDRGGELSVGDLFRCFSYKLGPLVILSLLYLAGWFVIWIVVVALVVAVLGAGSIGALAAGDASQAGMAILASLGTGALIVVLVGALLVIPLMMAYWFAPALIVLRGAEPIAAMKTSFRACLRNIPPFLVYGIVGFVLAIVAAIPFGLGWLVVAPMAVASTYAAYVDIFGRS
jgi:uncharacterized membrane protein